MSPVDSNQLIFLSLKLGMLLSQSLHIHQSKNDKTRGPFFNKWIIQSIIPNKYSSPSNPNNDTSLLLYLCQLNNCLNRTLKKLYWNLLNSKAVSFFVIQQTILSIMKKHHELVSFSHRLKYILLIFIYVK